MRLSLGDALTLRQEWKYQLRPAIHPALFAGAYTIAARLAALLHFDAARRAELLVATPKLIQASSAAACDYYTWKLGERVYGHGRPSAWMCVRGPLAASHP